MPAAIARPVYLVVMLVACGGATVDPVDAATTDAAPDAASVLPMAFRCAQAAGAACDPTTFAPACCQDTDDASTLHACDDAGLVVVTSCP